MNVQEKFPGFRLIFAEDDFLASHSKRYTGMGNIASSIKCNCPNCRNLMFPAFNFSFPDCDLHSIIKWKSPSLHVLFCPFCALYMAPYWIRHVEGGVEIVGGYMDGGEILQNIETPYACREISLVRLGEADYPLNEYAVKDLLERRREPSVYHQIGGMPIKGKDNKMACCDCAKVMGFIGVLDYDDLNVPLYEEDHSPVALIIGDYSSLNIYCCDQCSVLNP